ncbi:MAG: hypothetical protein PHW18_00810 [Sulfuricurvum sp.]|uniref:hypothetical protein n=1 Tax=Sulfuricurvum sp. TaxID=2025608 RepID=UPI00261A084F|nr:hypothetical protein [Sulfuricurvum sp.]MDD2828093.1 hypothetical protein [Sulfuricurvum sp.]MDD4948033.1 hypothetical protein [Sulfuricurvum sp.]
MHLKKFLSTLILVSISAQLYAYELGHGATLNDTLTVGGYFSSGFQSNEQKDTLTFDDVAVLAYGDINSRFSYLGELEAVGFYQKNFTDGSDGGTQKFHIERLYGDAWISDAFNIRFGKQITPIGYWNLEPINVLRDTTSNPLYSMLLFPKFLTGIDINGYIPQCDSTRYHLFGQSTHDMDEEYINIPNTHFYGLSLEHEFPSNISVGGSIGEFTPLNSKEKTRFIQANWKYDSQPLLLTAEGVIAKKEYSDSQNDYVRSGYLQSVYHFSNEHALIGRYEYYNDQHQNYTDNIGILGYSYRPLYPVSIKGEYQWHSQENLDCVLLSFSVLF